MQPISVRRTDTRTDRLNLDSFDTVPSTKLNIEIDGITLFSSTTITFNKYTEILYCKDFYVIFALITR